MTRDNAKIGALCDCALCQSERGLVQPWKGKLSLRGIKAARERLGVSGQVVVRRASCRARDPELEREGWTLPGGAMDRVSGTYAMRSDGTHVITLDPRLGRQEANACFFHELTHAAQAERHGLRQFQMMYRSENRRRGYDCNRFEEEARESERTLPDELPPVVVA